MKGWLVSKESPSHRERWARVLAPYFEDFQIVLDNKNCCDWKPESEFDMVFTTNILDTSIRFQSRVRPDRHIAISNSYDLMVTGSGLHGESLRAELPQVRELWVDTHWALELLRDTVTATVRYVPWGLENFPPASTRHTESPFLVIPRLGSSHYNPRLAMDTAAKVIDLCPQVDILFLGLANTLQKDFLRSNQVRGKFKFLTILPEEAFLDVLRGASAVLMTPETDGASIVMLQSLWMGIPVVSTPTIGAREWIDSALTDFSVMGSDPDSLANAISRSIHQGVSSAKHHSTRNRLLSVANMALNVKSSYRADNAWL